MGYLYNGDAQLKGTLQVLSNKPLDSRLVVQRKNELYSLDPSTAYLGMPVVSIEDDSIYILKNINKISTPEGWKEVRSQQQEQPQQNNMIALSQSQYDILVNNNSIDVDTFYFIYEDNSSEQGWIFGGTFPITFGSVSTNWTFGNNFPIKLT